MTWAVKYGTVHKLIQRNLLKLFMNSNDVDESISFFLFVGHEKVADILIKNGANVIGNSQSSFTKRNERKKINVIQFHLFLG